jgi:hypothetical protein
MAFLEPFVLIGLPTLDLGSDSIDVDALFLTPFTPGQLGLDFDVDSPFAEPPGTCKYLLQIVLVIFPP